MSAKVRQHAARCLEQVLDQGHSLRDILQQAPEHLSPSDRGLLRHLCSGVLRYLPALNGVLQPLLSKPIKPKDQVVQYLLLTAIYSHVELKTPDHALVNETVEAAKAWKKKSWAPGFVNAVLRAMLRAQIQWQPQAAEQMPRWLMQALADAYGDQHPVFEQLLKPAPLTVRLRQGVDSAQWLQQLSSMDITADACSWAPRAYRLHGQFRPDQLPAFAEGQIVIQDEAAQLAGANLPLTGAQRVLDACCAPGGKTMYLADRLPEHATLIAADVDTRRLQRVEENLQRLGLKVRVEQRDLAVDQVDYADQPFDSILLDAPCSATGIIRRHPDIKWLRRASDIQELVTLQAQMLDLHWQWLKPGGHLLYCTCSLLPDENANQVQNFLKLHEDASLLPLEYEIGEDTHFGRQVLPSEQGADGFFYALLHKVKE